MTTMFVGWIGLVLLVVSYCSLLTKYDKFFYPLNAIASVTLAFYAYTLNSHPFVIVNVMVALIVIYKWIGDYI
jgi:hypothetical protein